MKRSSANHRTRMTSICYETAFLSSHNWIILVRGNLPSGFIAWVKSYLTDRYQQVIINQETSHPIRISSGVPQGSVLSPYVFAAHMGSLTPLNDQSHMIKYADDVAIGIPVKCLTDVGDFIAKEVAHVREWCLRNGLELNEKKSKCLVIAKRNKDLHAILDTCPPNIEICSQLKLLGITYNSRLCWDDHINIICKKANRNIFVLRQMKSFVNKDILTLVYSSLVRSILEYCNPLFIGINKKQSKKLEKVRKHCHRIICDKECKCERFPELRDRRETQAISFFLSMEKHDNILNYLFPRRLTHSQKLAMPLCITNRRLTSFLPQCIQLCNRIWPQTCLYITCNWLIFSNFEINDSYLNDSYLKF